MSERTPTKKAGTPEGREQQNIALAVDLAEKQLRDGTAGQSVIVHYLKLATEERKLEQLKIQQEIETMKAKADQARSQAHLEEVYEKALAALREYQGLGPQEVDPSMFDSGSMLDPGGQSYFDPGGGAYV